MPKRCLILPRLSGTALDRVMPDFLHGPKVSRAAHPTQTPVPYRVQLLSLTTLLLLGEYLIAQQIDQR